MLFLNTCLWQSILNVDLIQLWICLSFCIFPYVFICITAKLAAKPSDNDRYATCSFSSPIPCICLSTIYARTSERITSCTTTTTPNHELIAGESITQRLHSQRSWDHNSSIVATLQYHCSLCVSPPHIVHFLIIINQLKNNIISINIQFKSFFPESRVWCSFSGKVD
jgi:hypothetical protein